MASTELSSPAKALGRILETPQGRDSPLIKAALASQATPASSPTPKPETSKVVKERDESGKTKDKTQEGAQKKALDASRESIKDSLENGHDLSKWIIGILQRRGREKWQEITQEANKKIDSAFEKTIGKESSPQQSVENIKVNCPEVIDVIKEASKNKDLDLDQRAEAFSKVLTAVTKNGELEVNQTLIDSAAQSMAADSSIEFNNSPESIQMIMDKGKEALAGALAENKFLARDLAQASEADLLVDESIDATLPLLSQIKDGEARADLTQKLDEKMSGTDKEIAAAIDETRQAFFEQEVGEKYGENEEWTDEMREELADELASDADVQPGNPDYDAELYQKGEKVHSQAEEDAEKASKDAGESNTLDGEDNANDNDGPSVSPSGSGAS